MPQTIDTLLSPQWIVPITPHETVFTDHALAIDAGKILEILPQAEAKARYQAKENIALPTHVVMPGLVNGHTHSPMSLFRGLADDLPLMTWLTEHIWPAENKWLGEELIHDGMQLAMAEMLKSGTTCFNEHYLFPEVAAKTTLTSGMRACIGLFYIDAPTAWAKTPEEYFAKITQTYSEFGTASDLMTFSLAPHAPYTVGDEAFTQLKAFSDKHSLMISLHTHETASEIAMSLEQHGMRPLKRLHGLGLLSPQLQCVHMVQANAEDIKHLQATGTQVIHCPESNLKLASGFCPVQRLQTADVNIGLGTDGAASNNDLDMFSEMRTAALLAKAVAKDPTALPAADALHMATLGGAKALGLGDTIGSLEAGKAADVIAVDLDRCNTQPVYNPLSQLVYATNGQQVTDVWVAGKQLVKSGALTTLNEADILAKAQSWAKRIGGESR